MQVIRYIFKMIFGILLLGGLALFVLDDFTNPFAWVVALVVLIAGRKLIFPAIFGIALMDSLGG